MHISYIEHRITNKYTISVLNNGGIQIGIVEKSIEGEWKKKKQQMND